jgi:hypothetical protein
MTWKQLPGTARDIAIGADNSAWVIGTNAVQGGYGIHRWDGGNWQAVDGGAVRIAVGPDGMPWVVNDSGQIYQRTNAGWQLRPGSAHDIGVGPDNSVWVIGTNAVHGGYGIHRWTGTSWEAVDGGGMRIAVGPNSTPWVVNDQQQLYRRDGSGWKLQGHTARDVAVSAHGATWIIGTGTAPGGYEILSGSDASWAKVDGGGINIAVDDTDNPWVVNDAGGIYEGIGIYPT